MNDYEIKQENRRQRYLDLADKNDAKSDSAYQASHNATAGIPFGQPILIGHHSEKRHRRDLERSDNAMRKSHEASETAKYYRSKAASVGKAGISSDDPEAVTKLQAKIDAAKLAQTQWKACNKIVRKKTTNEAKIQALRSEGLSAASATKLLEQDFAGRVGFPAYLLTNNNANIKRMEQRIEQLRQAPTETTEEEHDGITVVNNAEENRIQLIFPGKPPASVRAILKSHGFRWSPRNTAWQRHLNSNGQYVTKLALKAIAEESCDTPT